MPPNISPIVTCANARAKVAVTTRRGFAPSATRMPISGVRRDTVKDSRA
jgi:hypothetical protein